MVRKWITVSLLMEYDIVRIEIQYFFVSQFLRRIKSTCFIENLIEVITYCY